MLQYLGIVMIKQQGYEYLEKMVQRDARFGLHGALTKKKISPWNPHAILTQTVGPKGKLLFLPLFSFIF